MEKVNTITLVQLQNFCITSMAVIGVSTAWMLVAVL